MPRTKNPNSPPKEYVEYGRRLERARLRLDLTQDEVAARIEAILGEPVSRMRYQQWESGENPINIKLIAAVAEALNTTPLSILYDENTPSMQEELLLEGFRRLTPDNKERLLKMLELL